MLDLLTDPRTMAFIPMAVILTVTPGTDTMLVVRSALMRGKTCGAITAVGICFGLFVHALVSSLGLSMILVHSAALFMAVKMLGALYIVYLGVQSLRLGLKKGQDADLPEMNRTVSRRKAFMEGFLTNVLNPKVAVFYLALLPQFVNHTDPVLAKTLLLTSIHWIISIAWLIALALGMGQLKSRILRPGFNSKLNCIAGGAFICLGLQIAYESR